MKTLFIFLLCLSTLSLPAQGLLPGLITYQNSGNTPVPGALVKASLTHQQETAADGSFLLRIPGKKPGSEVRLRVEKAGYEVVNKQALLATLKADQRLRLKLYLCPEGEWERNAIAYYEINEEKITARYRQQVAQARQELADNYTRLSDSLAQLAEQYQLVLRQAEELAQKFALANLDDASELYKEAFAYFTRGEIDSAIAVLDDELLDQQMAAAQGEKVEAQVTFDRGTQKDSSARQARQQLARGYAVKARAASHQQPPDWPQVFAAYAQAVRLDSTHLAYQEAYAEALEQGGFPRKALEQYQSLLTKVSSPQEQVTLLHRMSHLYTRQGKLSQALSHLEQGLRWCWREPASLSRGAQARLLWDWSIWQMEQKRLARRPYVVWAWLYLLSRVPHVP